MSRQFPVVRRGNGGRTRREREDVVEGGFEADLARAKADCQAARHDLLAVVAALKLADLDLARRGGWSVRAILLHVIEGERHYAEGIRFMRRRQGKTAAPRRLLRSPEDALLMLDEVRGALFAAVEGVDEDMFYRLQRFSNEEGHGQDYSVLTVLENVANHDREHADQIRATLESIARS